MGYPTPVRLSPRAAFKWLRIKQPLRWSFKNWCRGYQFRPIQRCRHCDHTSPYHYPTCIAAQDND